MTAQIDSGSLGLWQAVSPLAGVNYLTNPSGEVDAALWGAFGGTTVRTVGAGVFGGYGFAVTTTGGTGGANTATITVPATGHMTFSVYVRATSASVGLYMSGAGLTSVTEQIAHPGDGLWHRLEVAGDVSVGGTLNCVVVDYRTSGTRTYDFDGAVLEFGPAATTYIDGDQPGCSWDGKPHASTSTRDGRDSRGGVLTSFDSLGLLVMEQHGLGMPPVDVATQSLAQADGEQYTRTKAKSRVITLTALLDSTGLANLHAKRLAVENLFNPDNRRGRGPVVLRYTGSATKKRITAYYEAGLEQAPPVATYETIPLRFAAPDPIWEGETDSQAVLAAPATIVSPNHIVQRTPGGTWQALGLGLTGGNPLPRARALGVDGSLYVGGTFTAADAGPVSGVTRWYQGNWYALGTGMNGPVFCTAVGPDGTLYAGGEFTTADGSGANCIAKWNGSGWSQLGSGLTIGAGTARCATMCFDTTGYLVVGGNFTNAGGTTVSYVAQWSGSAWSAVGTGNPTVINQIVRAPDALYLCGGGTTGVYRWSGSAWVLIGAATGGAPGAYSLAVSPSGVLYLSGSFTSIGGVAAQSVAKYTGSTWEPLGAGITGTLGGALFVQDIAFDAAGTLYAAGQFAQAGSVLTSDPIAQWNGSSWSQVDANLPGVATVDFILPHPDGALTIGFDAAGNAVVPVVNVLTNTGSTMAYPVIRFTTTGYTYSLINWTTGARIDFHLLGLAGETFTLDLRPGRKFLSSSFRPNLMQYVLPGSDLDSWGLVPGANRVALHIQDGAMAAVAWWKSRFWAAD